MHRITSTTPNDDRFFMPAEWARHLRTWMLWPQRVDNWRQNAGPAQAAFGRVAAVISKFEPVVMGTNPELIASARQQLPSEVQVIEIPNNDAWMRDCGPTFVVNKAGSVRLINWKFNAWGGLYADWQKDEKVPLRIAENEHIDLYDAPLIMEGGSFHVDGEGSLLTTEECLLNPNRNPHLKREQIENYLHQYTGANKILWLKAGIYNDETSGHVDNIACFLRPGLVALAWTDDHNDPQYPISQDAFQRLSGYCDAKGRKLEIIKIHQPNPIFITEEEAAGVVMTPGTWPRRAGDRMAASYVNLYLCNGAAVVPQFNDEYDSQAIQTLQRAIPERTVVGVSSREILLGGGNIHCITQQQPVM
jgi:agmatine deiminase